VAATSETPSRRKRCRRLHLQVGAARIGAWSWKTSRSCFGRMRRPTSATNRMLAEFASVFETLLTVLQKKGDLDEGHLRLIAKLRKRARVVSEPQLELNSYSNKYEVENSHVDVREPDAPLPRPMLLVQRQASRSRTSRRASSSGGSTSRIFSSRRRRATASTRSPRPGSAATTSTGPARAASTTAATTRGSGSTSTR